jgi:hypothetical protein
MDFESIKFLLVLDEFHGESFPFLGDKASGDALFEDTDFREDHLDFSVHLINGIELDEKPAEKLLSCALCELGLFILNHMGLNDLHLVDDDLLAQIALATFIIDLVLNLIFIALGRGVVLYVTQHHFR